MPDPGVKAVSDFVRFLVGVNGSALVLIPGFWRDIAPNASLTLALKLSLLFFSASLLVSFWGAYVMYNTELLDQLREGGVKINMAAQGRKVKPLIRLAAMTFVAGVAFLAVFIVANIP